MQVVRNADLLPSGVLDYTRVLHDLVELIDRIATRRIERSSDPNLENAFAEVPHVRDFQEVELDTSAINLPVFELDGDTFGRLLPDGALDLLLEGSRVDLDRKKLLSQRLHDTCFHVLKRPNALLRWLTGEELVEATTTDDVGVSISCPS